MRARRSILEPFRFPRTGRRVRNRIVLAAMTNKQSHEDGSLGDDELHWLRARASFGIVTTCAAHVALDGQGWEGELGVYDDALLPGLSSLAGALREAGTTSLCQIFHGGVRAPSRLTGQQAFSASAFELDTPNFEVPRAADREDIERTIAAFAAAAERCDRAGFDGVEIHGAHGYLISQFLGTVTNTRQDDWGGSLEKRARFVREIVREARACTREDFLIGVRLSPELEEQGIALADSIAVARMLVADGVDFLHVSNWDSFESPKSLPDSGRTLTEHFRSGVGDEIPLIATGAVWTRAQADAVLADGADMVGLARAAIGNADWARRIAADPDWEPLRPPYTSSHLRSQALGPRFIEYMKRWPNFVEDLT